MDGQVVARLPSLFGRGDASFRHDIEVTAKDLQFGFLATVLHRTERKDGFPDPKLQYGCEVVEANNGTTTRRSLAP